MLIGRPARQMRVERQAGVARRCVQYSHRDGDRCVAAEPRLLRRPVQPDQHLIDPGLIRRIATAQRLRNIRTDVVHGTAHVIAAETRAAVAQIDRLAGAHRSAGGRNGAPDRAALERHLGFYGRAGARIPDAPAQHVDDPRHAFLIAVIQAPPSRPCGCHAIVVTGCGRAESRPSEQDRDRVHR